MIHVVAVVASSMLLAADVQAQTPRPTESAGLYQHFR